MQILYYAAHREKTGNELSRILRTSVPGLSVERYTTVEGLARRLVRKLEIKTVAVVHAASDEDLIDIYYIQHLLSKVLLILLLPDTERLTVAMGHRLHPRFMCRSDADSSEIADALKSIARHGYVPKPIEAFSYPFKTVMPVSPMNSEILASNILTLQDMADLGNTMTDTYVLSMTYHDKRTNGIHGVDPVTHTAWAVVNYTGDFAVARDIEF